MATNSEFGPLCIPGTKLSNVCPEYKSGPGTYELNGCIHAAMAGIVKTRKLQKENTMEIFIESPKTPGVIPEVGDVVTAKVTVVNSRQVNCTIMCVGPSVLERTYRGIIRKEDIRKQIQIVDPYKCFRPGDIILAKVLPVTEIHWYYLTTAENELGVAIATADGSPQGVNMLPLSWSEMQCPKTLVKEPRKVARIPPENLDHALFPIEDEKPEETNKTRNK